MSFLNQSKFKNDEILKQHPHDLNLLAKDRALKHDYKLLVPLINESNAKILRSLELRVGEKFQYLK